MKSFRTIFITFSIAMLALFIMLSWGGMRFYAYEQSRLAQATDAIVKLSADSIQRANLTLNNMMALDNDSEREEKTAFAIGMAGNQGKMRMYFGEKDTIHAPKAPDTIIKINRAFMQRYHARYIPEAVKAIQHFDTVFKHDLKEQHINIPYRLYAMSLNDTSYKASSYLSTPFILNFYDPASYRVGYSLPFRSVLPGILPYLGISTLLLLMALGSFVFYYRSYRLQGQMAAFKESLFSNVTHELKTPLSSLQLIIDAAGSNTINAIATISAEHLKFAKEETHRMQLLIDKILSFGKMDKEQIALNKERIDLDALLSDAIKIMSLSIQQSGGIIHYNNAQQLYLIGDRSLLINTITTFIGNAVKYNANIPSIHITTSLVNSMIHITITDNGIGIPAAYHKRIFQPFFRMPTGNLHDVKGHGLGLSFAQQVITLHGGSIQLVSEAGKGSTFTLMIPAA